MSMPGFTADNSLGQMKYKYPSSPGHAAAALAVLPAFYNPVRCFTDPNTGKLVCYTLSTHVGPPPNL